MSAIALAMADAARHRGPDAGGLWTDPRRGLALAHRRLAILDLSDAGAQPMTSACGRYVITYNGEVYNFGQLRTELSACGHTFRGTSDTEVMLAGFTRWGVAAVERFNGMFAFALWDTEQRRLHLARDRMGEKPLYWGWQGDTLLFGSELKQLRAHPAFRAEVNRDALALLLRHNYIPGPYSIYEGIYKLPPATILTVDADAGSGRPRVYWDLRAVAEAGTAMPLTADAEELADTLESLLSHAVGLRMAADVPLGAFLSGGVDSSLVVALMQQQSSRPIRTFTIGFSQREYDEAPFAAAVARHLGTDHTQLTVTPRQMLDVVPRLPVLYDEPFSDPSQIPTAIVSALAREQVTVVLTGDGGDELFAGYRRYRRMADAWRRLERVPHLLRRMISRLITTPSRSAWDALLTPLRARGPLGPEPSARLHDIAAVLPARRPEPVYHALVSHWRRPCAVVLGSSEPPTRLTTAEDWPDLPTLQDTLSWLDMVTYLPDDILVKTDRAAMGVGLEGRTPLLDHRVVELAWRLPLDVRIRNGQGKWLLRRVLDRHVPRGLIDRPKRGFGAPIGDWLRGPLRDWAEALLDEPRLRREGFFAPQVIRRRWAQHRAGQANWSGHLWDVLMFQSWLESR